MGEALGTGLYHGRYCGPIPHLRDAAGHVKRSAVTGWVLMRFMSATRNKGGGWHPMPERHVAPAPEPPPSHPWGDA